jgi:DNA repair exonuclease SbcCD ATPase subunit
MVEATYTLQYVQEQIDAAVAEERVKWERVISASEQVGDATNEQVEELTKQLATLREKMRLLNENKEREFEERLSSRVKDLTQSHLDEVRQVRLECLDREKCAVKKLRDEMEAALLAERQASEMFLQQLGVDEDERVRKKVKEARKDWLAHREAMASELEGAHRRVEELEEMVAGSEAANLAKAKEQIKRERARTRKIEKQLQAAMAEVQELKTKMQEKAQQQFQGPLENLTHESPEVAKMHKLVEVYKNEARALRQQIDAQKPERLVELQGNLKIRDEEESKLRDEIKTLKSLLSRQVLKYLTLGTKTSKLGILDVLVPETRASLQEREIKANKDMDAEYGKKMELLVGDIQVS